jgi:hypothetical protein
VVPINFIQTNILGTLVFLIIKSRKKNNQMIYYSNNIIKIAKKRRVEICNIKQIQEKLFSS